MTLYRSFSQCQYQGIADKPVGLFAETSCLLVFDIQSTEIHH